MKAKLMFVLALLILSLFPTTSTVVAAGDPPKPTYPNKVALLDSISSSDAGWYTSEEPDRYSSGTNFVTIYFKKGRVWLLPMDYRCVTVGLATKKVDLHFVDKNRWVFEPVIDRYGWKADRYCFK